MSSQTTLFVGSLSRATPYFSTAEGAGITTWRFDEETGALTLVNTFAGVDNPTFIARDPARNVIYAVSEVYGWNEGMVTALRYDLSDGSLSYVNKQPTRGSITAHASLDRTGRYLFVTNYAHEVWEGPYGEDTPRQATCVFPLGDDGTIGPATDSVQHNGTGPVPVRQGEPHPHCAMASPDNRFVLVTDLGIDAVVTYRFTDGTLTRASSFAARPGAGPRHLKFTADGTSAYLLNELDSTVYHLSYDPKDGTVGLIQSIDTVPEERKAGNRCSELVLSADGKFLYAANRGDDSVTAFSVAPSTGTLERVSITPSGGRTPRNICLSPSGNFLLAANQDGHTLAVFRRNLSDGTIAQVNAAEVGTPMVIVPAT